MPGASDFPWGVEAIVYGCLCLLYLCINCSIFAQDKKKIAVPPIQRRQRHVLQICAFSYTKHTSIDITQPQLNLMPRT